MEVAELNCMYVRGATGVTVEVEADSVRRGPVTLALAERSRKLEAQAPRSRYLSCKACRVAAPLVLIVHKLDEESYSELSMPTCERLKHSSQLSFCLSLGTDDSRVFNTFRSKLHLH